MSSTLILYPPSPETLGLLMAMFSFLFFYMSAGDMNLNVYISSALNHEKKPSIPPNLSLQCILN